MSTHTEGTRIAVVPPETLIVLCPTCRERVTKVYFEPGTPEACVGDPCGCKLTYDGMVALFIDSVEVPDEL